MHLTAEKIRGGAENAEKTSASIASCLPRHRGKKISSVDKKSPPYWYGAQNTVDEVFHSRQKTTIFRKDLNRPL